MIIKQLDGSFRLQILERFEIDENLKKFQKNKDTTQVEQGTLTRAGSFFVSQSSSSSSSIVSFTNSDSTFNSVVGGSSDYSRMSIFSRLVQTFAKLFSHVKTKYNEVPINIVFQTIISNQKELEHLKVEAGKLTDIMNKSKEMGQIALFEKLKKELPIKLLEEKLFFNGFTKYISEQDVIKFSRNSERGLKLSFIKNFIRNVPSEVQALKIKADALEVFDNYAVMFYDPENKSTAMTEKEIEKAKDPILFGLIRNSDKLYFVGDWKDEFCDLTFDEMLLKLAEQKTEPVKETTKNEASK